MRAGSLTVILLALAGCSQRSAPGNVAQAQAAAPSPGAIPADYRGRYALTPRDCAPERGGDVRGLLTIGEDGFAFGVTPTRVDRVALLPGRLLFDATETKEGVTASRRYALRISPDKRVLTREEAGLPDRVYTRCPDRPS